MMKQISLHIKNINLSTSLTIKCNQLSTVLDVKQLVAKQLGIAYPCCFKLIKGVDNLEDNLESLLTDCNIEDEDIFYLMHTLNKERAVLCEWFRQDGHNWTEHENWLSDRPLSEWHGVETNEEGNIIRMNLRGNNISLLSKEISLLHNLKYLDLSYNKISVVPKEVSQLHSLEYLRLKSNRLTTLPKEFAQSPNLAMIDASDNYVLSLPDELMLARSINKPFIDLVTCHLNRYMKNLYKF